MAEQRAKEKEHNLSLRDGAPSPVIARSEATKQSQDRLGTSSAIPKNEIPRSMRPRNDILKIFPNEKGIALVMVLVLSAIILVIMAGLIYMLTTGTQLSGMQKRYKTALEAGTGGTDVIYQLIATRGDPNIPLTNFLITASNVGGVDCLTPKLNQPTSSWPVACNNSLTINPDTQSTYDMQFDLGTAPTYRVYAKIADTVLGNSGSDEGLLKGGVVHSTGEINVASIPFLYTIEVDAQNQANPAERAKLSILYQY